VLHLFARCGECAAQSEQKRSQCPPSVIARGAACAIKVGHYSRLNSSSSSQSGVSGPLAPDVIGAEHPTGGNNDASPARSGVGEVRR